MPRVVGLVLLFVLFRGIPPATAWTPPQVVNGTLLRGEPSCVGDFYNSRVVCAALSTKGAVVVSHYDPSDGDGWTAWKTLPGAVSSPPSCTANRAGKVVCAARAVGGQLQYSVYDPAVNLWTAPAKVAGSALYSGPSCTSPGFGRVLCAARGSTGGLTYSVFDGVAWSAFASVASAGLILSRPACTSPGGFGAGVMCAVIGAGNIVYTGRYDGAWGAFTSIGGIAGSDDIRCFHAGQPLERDACVVTGTDGFVYINSFSGTAWSGWGRLGTLQTNYGVTCALLSQVNGWVCGALNVTDNALYTIETFGRTWVRQGGTGTGTPSCTTIQVEQAVCAFPGVNNKLYYTLLP